MTVEFDDKKENYKDERRKWIKKKKYKDDSRNWMIKKKF
jgi:hypothetical protein